MPSCKTYLRALNVRRHQLRRYRRFIGFRMSRKLEVRYMVLAIVAGFTMFVLAGFGWTAMALGVVLYGCGIRFVHLELADSVERSQHILRLYDSLPTAADKVAFFQELGRQDFTMFYALLTSRVGSGFLAINHENHQPEPELTRLRLIVPD